MFMIFVFLIRIQSSIKWTKVDDIYLKITIRENTVKYDIHKTPVLTSSALFTRRFRGGEVIHKTPVLTSSSCSQVGSAETRLQLLHQEHVCK